MEFCVISPASGLERYATRSHTHLVLAHIENTKYREFYKWRRELGDTLILDNGAHELDVSVVADILLDGMRWYKPQIVVLPDIYLGNWVHSLELSRQFASRVAASRFEFKLDQQEWEWMLVPQAEPNDGDGWNKALRNGIEFIQPTWIGLSRNLVADRRGTVFADSLARVWLCRNIVNIYQRRVHALGMQAGCLPELWALHHAGCISVDSGAPVWRGWNGFGLYTEQEWPDIPLNFGSNDCPPVNSERDYIINANLKECFKYACYTGPTHTVQGQDLESSADRTAF